MHTRQTGPVTIGNRPPRAGSRVDAAAAGRGATPQAAYERYIALARAKALAGDRIEAERCYQYAEHYHRLIHGSAA